MNIQLDHQSYRNCELVFDQYPNKQNALIIYHEGQVLLKASVCMPNYSIPPDYICIKDWSENEGLLRELINAKIIEYPDNFIQSGFVSVPVCKIIKGVSNDNEENNSSLV